jgi:hypothetical protein
MLPGGASMREPAPPGDDARPDPGSPGGAPDALPLDVFGVAAQPAGGFLRDAAIAAGHALGVFAALATGPRTAAELAAALGIAASGGAGPHRLRALLDVLAALGAIDRAPGGGPRFAAGASRPAWPVVTAAGWGLLADVIRRDQPLPVAGDDPAASERRLHHHLATAGAAAAAELVRQLDATSLCDLGAGAGAYARAFLAADPTRRATLVDAAPVLALAAGWLGELAPRAELVAGDARRAALGELHDVALLANVLHLHSMVDCAELCAAAARAVAPGGLVVIKDLRVDDDRRGPLAGLLFALNMAIYTPAGDVYATGQLRAWLVAAGLGELRELRLAAAPDAIVVIGRRPSPPSHRAGPAQASAATAVAGEVAGLAAIAAELDAALEATAGSAWHAVKRKGALAAAAPAPPRLGFPPSLRSFLAAALHRERGPTGEAGRAAALLRHYTEVMPAMRIVQLAGSDEPGATLFHAPLTWDRLPRLAAAIDRLFEVVAGAGIAPDAVLGAPTAAALRARSPTLAALYARTHYGGCMPLLYGAPADLAYVHSCGLASGDLPAAIDRYLTAPIVHELCHFAPGRVAVLPPHLDECIAGWLGVHVHAELAYPTGAHDDALFAAPWLAQVGQAFARGFGVASVVRAHAGGDATALPAGVVAAAARLGWDDWCARRTQHFLSDTFDPAPWVALALAGAAGRSLADATVATLAALPLAGLALPADPAFDRAIVEDALRAMCLTTALVAGSFRTRAQVPDAAIAIDASGCAVTAARRGELSPVAPRYWLPPAVAARLIAQGRSGYALTLGSVAAIPAAAAAICAAAPGGEGGGFMLAEPHGS